MRYILACLLWLLLSTAIFATNYNGTPSNYLGFISQLQPGDTLFLASGTYMDRMNLDDIVGTENAPIVIQGPDGTNGAVFTGNACCNTISLERCAYLEIRNLTIDGQNIPFIDAVKAEGTNGNWTHNITLENLLVINHGGAALTTGINTKCPSWDWVIRKNTFIEPGLGMYLGNSDGNGPFINGLIEYNLILNPIRYGLQIKHQNEGQRTIDGMTTDGKTTIRYNVISRESGFDPDTPRPNLLVGNFPASGPGENDYYEIYGNLLWQNPNEGLFQGTGNIAFYNNILVNEHEGGWGIFSFPHNNFNPRELYYFNNTILCATTAIEINNPNTNFEQIVTGNAIFADIPLDLGNITANENVAENLVSVSSFLTDPFAAFGALDLTPKDGTLLGPLIDSQKYEKFSDYDKDFDGQPKGWEYRGAYASDGPPRWMLDLIMRPEIEDMTSSIRDFFNIIEEQLRIYPNPTDHSFSLEFAQASNREMNLTVTNLQGQIVYERSLQNSITYQIDLPGNLNPGIYLVSLYGEFGGITKKLMIVDGD